MAKLEPLCTVARNVKWHSCCGKQCGSSSENEKWNSHMTQQFHFWVCNPPPTLVSQRDMCTLVLIAALFKVAKPWEQPKRLSGWMDKQNVVVKGKIQFFPSVSFPYSHTTTKHFWRFMGDFPHQAILWHRVGVLQLDSVLTLSTSNNIRSHRLRAQSHETVPLLQLPIRK